MKLIWENRLVNEMVKYPIDEILSSLKAEEGYSATCYLCSAGKHTVAYGRNISPGGIGISKEEADYLLRNDVNRTIKECQNFKWFDKLDSQRQSVIVQLCFQLGYPALSTFHLMLAALSQSPPDFKTAAAELLDSKFAKQDTPARAKRMAQQLAG